MPKSLAVVRATLENLIEVFTGKFDPEQFFADTSRLDLMKLAVQLGRDGAITINRVMEYVQASYDVSTVEAPVFAMQLFRTLEPLSAECGLPFTAESPRVPRQTRNPKAATEPPQGTDKKGHRAPHANSPMQKLIAAFGTEGALKKALVDAIRKEGKEKHHGAVQRAFILLSAEPKCNFLKALLVTQRSFILSQLGIDSKKILSDQE